MFLDNGAINKHALDFGFGVSNSLGYSASVFIPVCVYGINCSEKLSHRIFYLVTTLCSYSMVVISLCRNGLLFGTVALVVSFVLCSFFGKERKFCRVVTLVGLAAVLVALILFGGELIDYVMKHIIRTTSDNGRFDIWEACVDIFTRYPIFGGGIHALFEYHGVGDS